MAEEKKQRKPRQNKTEIEKIAGELVKVNNSNDLKSYSDKFQLAFMKREMIRATSYLEITNEVDKAVVEAIKKEIASGDAERTFDVKKVTDNSLDRFYKMMGFIRETPQNVTLINQQTSTHNTTVNSFDANSRAKVRDTVSAILSIAKQHNIDPSVIAGEKPPPDEIVQEEPAITNNKKEESNNA